MNARTKAILERSLNDMKGKTQAEKEEMVSIVIEQLTLNKKGIDTIGIGLDEDMVQAGKIFLRLNHDNIPLPF